LIAIDETLKDAMLDDFSKFRVGVYMDTTVASQLSDIEFYRRKFNTSGIP
jgi:hypothetical protein